MDALGIRSRDHLWQLSLVGLAALVVLVISVLLLRSGDDQTATVGQLAANEQGLAVPLVAGPSAENDRDANGEQRSVGAIATSDEETATTRQTLVASTTSATEATTTTAAPVEPITTETTVAETTTTTEEATTTAPPVTEPSTTTEQTKPTVTITLPPITEPTITLPTITIPLPPPGEHSITRRDLAEARERFASTGYSSYAMTVRRSCFCLPEYIGPFDVVVRDGHIVSVTNVGGFDIDAVPANQQTLTVPGLFDFIEAGFDSDRMDVTFDKQTGVPLNISIDHIFGAVDDEISITVSNFSPQR